MRSFLLTPVVIPSEDRISMSYHLNGGLHFLLLRRSTVAIESSDVNTSNLFRGARLSESHQLQPSMKVRHSKACRTLIRAHLSTAHLTRRERRGSCEESAGGLITTSTRRTRRHCHACGSANWLCLEVHCRTWLADQCLHSWEIKS